MKTVLSHNLLPTRSRSPLLSIYPDDYLSIQTGHQWVTCAINCANKHWCLPQANPTWNRSNPRTTSLTTGWLAPHRRCHRGRGGWLSLRLQGSPSKGLGNSNPLASSASQQPPHGREAKQEAGHAEHAHRLCFSSQAALSASRQAFSVTRRSSRLAWPASAYSLSRAVSTSSL